MRTLLIRLQAEILGPGVIEETVTKDQVNGEAATALLPGCQRPATTFSHEVQPVNMAVCLLTTNDKEQQMDK